MASLFWDESVDHTVLAVAASNPCGTALPFDIAGVAHFATVLRSGDGERLTLSNGISRISLHLIEGSVLAGPVALRFVIDDARAPMQVRTLLRLRALRERGAFGAWLHRPEPRARRWIHQLRAVDALVAGASDRDIASALFGSARVTLEWSDRDGSLRSAVRRLIAAARRNLAGGYRDILRGA